MKKFLSKKPVFIAALVLAVVCLVFYVGMLVRPIAIGMTYKGTSKITILGETEEAQLEAKVISGKIIETTTITDGEKDTSKTTYIVYNGYLFFVGDEDMTADQYKEAKKNIKENFDEQKKDAIKINAFSAEQTASGAGYSAEIKLACGDEIAFSIIMGIVEAALIGFAATSTVFFIKSRKK